jgi:hypothetical protein
LSIKGDQLALAENVDSELLNLLVFVELSVDIDSELFGLLLKLLLLDFLQFRVQKNQLLLQFFVRFYLFSSLFLDFVFFSLLFLLSS